MKKLKKIFTFGLMAIMLSITLGSGLKTWAIKSAYVPNWEKVRNSGYPYYYTQIVDSDNEWIYYQRTFTQSITRSQDITPWNYPPGETLKYYEYSYKID